VNRLFHPLPVFAVPTRLAAMTCAALLLVSGCGYYSFTGASIPDHLGTIAIPLVDDRTVSTIGTLDSRMTQLLVERFVSQTRLDLDPQPETADAVLRVTIDRYQNAPTSVSGDEQAIRNRITISATVQYEDRVEEAVLLNRTFSSFEEYDPFTPSQEETAAIAVLEKLADDIFTAATSNW